MSLIDLNPGMLPGEAGLSAIANLFTELAKDLDADKKNQLAERFLEISKPYHTLNVAIANNVAKFVAKILNIKEADVVASPPAPPASS